MARRRRVNPRRMEPDNAEAAYLDMLGEIVAEIHAEVLPSLRRAYEAALSRRPGGERVVPRRDAPVDDVTALIAELSQQLMSGLDDERIALELLTIGQGVDGFGLARFAEVVGIDVSNLLPGAQGQIQAWVAENVDLIRTIPDRYFERLGETVQDGYSQGLRWEEISEQIQGDYGASQADADRIAVDQVGKLNGQLNERRQSDLGITSYIWRTSRDSRVRPEHEDREGRTYLWSQPPPDGHPGEPIRCRCFAEPILPADLRDDIQEEAA